MKARIRSLLDLVVQWFRPARRVRPEQFEEALLEMLADPKTRLLLSSTLRPVPIQGGAPTSAEDVCPGTFGTASCTQSRIYSFAFPDKVSIGMTNPSFPLDVLGGVHFFNPNAWGYSPVLTIENQTVDSDFSNGLLIKNTEANAPTSYLLRAESGGTVRFYIANNGNVGFGTASPDGTFRSKVLHLQTAGSVGAIIESTAAGGLASLRLKNPTRTWDLNLHDNLTGDDSLDFVDSGTSVLTLKPGGNVGIGTSDRLSRLTVKGRASFSATGTVSIASASPTTVTGSGTSFTTQVGIGDRIQVTTSFGTEIRTVTGITSDTSLSVDPNYPFKGTASGATMTVLPSLFRADDASGKAQVFISDEGFLGIAGTPIHDSDGVGYVLCNADRTLTDKNNEMRGYQSTVRYTRNTADADASGEGWDVLGYVGAVSLENMNLPPGDPNIRGQMKPFQSELRFEPKAAGAPHYNVLKPAINYLASLTKVTSDCTIQQWVGVYIDSPCPDVGSGATSAVTTGYGIWINDLDDAAHSLVKANAAAIKIDGFNEYSRILWTNCSAYCPSSGVLEFQATTAVQTASGVAFNAGSYVNASTGFRVGGAAPSGNYLRGNGTNFVSSTIQAADVPNLDASKITTGTMDAARLPDASASASGKVNTSAQTFAGLKTFQDGVTAGDLSATQTVTFDAASNVLKVRRYADLPAPLSASNFPATHEHEFGFVWDGENLWLIYNTGVNKWKWQGTQVV